MTRTVKVRVAVAVDSDGNWRAHGWPAREPVALSCESMQFAATSATRSGAIIHWIWADLPIPAPAEVEATVEGP